MESLNDFLSSLNLNFEVEWNQGWRKVSNEKYFTYVADEVPLESGRILKVLTVNDWRYSDSARVWTNKTDLQDYDQSKLTAAQKKLKIKQDKEKLALQTEAKLKANELWVKSQHINGIRPEYFKTKNLQGSYGCRLHHECLDTVLIPLVDEKGELWNIQQIFLSGEKQFLENSRVSELFHVIPGNEEISYLAEGLATGATINDATSARVFVAFNAGNMKKVAVILKNLYPKAKIVVCGDNDRHNAQNTGLLAAQEASKVLGHGFILPAFQGIKGSEPPSRDVSDFNDLARVTSLEVVKAQASCIQFAFDNRQKETSPMEEASPPQKVSLKLNTNLFDEETLEPLPLTFSKGKAIMPPQQRVADHLLNHLDHRLAQQDGSLYIYTGTHWQNLGMDAPRNLKRLFQFICSGEATSSFTNACYDLLLNTVPIVPENYSLSAPHPFIMNLKNGAVHLIRETKNNKFHYHLKFKPHSRNDYVTTILPYEYLETTQKVPENKPFLEYLDKIFKGDEDKESKILAIQEMFGSCLVGAFPHIFFCVGMPKTGKSTIIKMATHLVHESNCSGVDPTLFHGFNMESMANKLVNVVTDVVIHQKINDSIAKQVVDRIKFRISRKFQRDLITYLPAIHIFGGNGIPKTLEGAYKAHDRRWTFITFNNVVTSEGERSFKDIDSWLFEQNPQGIFEWALQGLKRLLTNDGEYTQPASGAEVMKEWQTDIVEEFLSAIREGTAIVDDFHALIFDDEARINKGVLANKFFEWCRSSLLRTALGKNTLYKRLRDLGVSEVVIDGVRYFKGIKMTGGVDA